MIQTFHLLIKDDGRLEELSITDEFVHLLRYDQVKEQMGLVRVQYNDIRVRNLAIHFKGELFEISLEDFQKFSILVNHYQRMQKAIRYYKTKFSPQLVDALVGNMDNLYRGLLNEKNPPIKITIASIPTRVLSKLKHYFAMPFKITSAKLGQGKYDNVKFLDGTAEFKLIFTLEEVALPNDHKVYELQSLTFDMFGHYADGEFIFNFASVRVDKERFLRFDEQLYKNRKEYLTLLLSHCQNEQGQDLQQVLKDIAKQFVQSNIES